MSSLRGRRTKQDTGYWMLVTASAEREAGYWMLDTGGGKKAMIAVAGNPKSKIQKPK
ncbi:MAG TPA: hypothetical protein VFF90_11435 [Saprospiraceae bacterium]|nr:hypothetical protein [Saprospiraceae bacterium]